MANVIIPTETKEGVYNQYDSNGVIFNKGALSVTKIEVLDLISEGQIDTLVTGDWLFSGNVGEIGWRTGTFRPYEVAPYTTDTRWLRSIYWNETAVLNSANKYNFQNVDVSFTPGYPNGSLLDESDPELTVSRTIGERLRGSSIGTTQDANNNLIGSTNNPNDPNVDFAKHYMVYNKNCKAIIVNIKIGQLSEVVKVGTTTTTHAVGDIISSTVDYSIYFRPLFSTVNKTPKNFTLGKAESILGKINYGFIRSSRIDFNSPYLDYKDFLGWELKIVRTTPDSLDTTLRNITYVDSLTEIYEDVFTYPNSAIVRQKFSAEFFQQVPARAFNTNLLKIKVPANYDPILKRYDETGNLANGYINTGWNGVFQSGKQWSDNPAWCYYDLLTNQRYGLGKYIDEPSVDKWTIYEVGKYCDTLVPDGYGNLEPRFTCNLIINSRDEAYKVVNDFASIFNAITYYGAGSIYVVQDVPKVPICQFTNANVENGDFSYSSSAKKARHTTALVRYNDKTNFYKPAVEYVEDLDGIRRYGITELDLTAFGCTSRGQAARFGRWALLSEGMETETVSFVAGMEGAFLRPGDIFTVFDSNKKSKRHAGRVYGFNFVGNDPLGHATGFITLDDAINDLKSGDIYKFTLSTPSWFYDTSLVTLSGLDYSGIRRSQLQSFYFSGIQASGTGIDGRTMISFNTGLDTSNYVITGNPIWMIEIASGTNNFIDSYGFPDSGYDLFRAIQIQEKEDLKYSVVGLQYAQEKFLQIESGLGFHRPKDIAANLVPTSPYPALSASVNLRSTASYANSPASRDDISYSFGSSGYSGITSYKTFVKVGPFTGNGVPDDIYLVHNLPYQITQGRYVTDGTGDHYIRVYAYNDDSRLYSTGFATGMVTATKIPTIQEVAISSLGFATDPADLLYGFKSSGIASSNSPQFVWQAGIPRNYQISNDFSYRVSIRAPSSGNIPSNTIYFQETGINIRPDQPNYTFNFSDNQASVGGPYRKYDVVVEAIDASGRTSAGNQINISPDTQWTNFPNGYDIMGIEHPKISNVWLSSGNTSFGEIITEQWIDSQGNIKIRLVSGDLPSFQGGFLFSSTGMFSGQNLTGQWSSKFPIYTGRLDFLAPDLLIGYDRRLTFCNTGYIAVGLFDEFDAGSFAGKGNVVTGSQLWCSNVVPIESSGSFSKLFINEQVTFTDPLATDNKTTEKIIKINQNSKNYMVFGIANTGAPGDFSKFIISSSSYSNT